MNLPVLVLILLPLALYLTFTDALHSRNPSLAELFKAYGLLLSGVCLGWAWWSLMVPRWRVWAWNRVTDRVALKQAAIRAKLIWPDGHIFGRTEFRTKALQERLAALEANDA